MEELNTQLSNLTVSKYDKCDKYPKPTKFYVVAAGRNVGIYTSWAETEKQVKGYPGAIFKSYTTREEADRAMNLFNGKQKKVTSEDEIKDENLPCFNRTVIYADGSGNGGYGVVIKLNNGDIYDVYGKIPFKATNNVAELYAIYVGLSLVLDDVVIYSDSRYAIECLSVRINEWMVTGWEGVSNREIIEATHAKMANRQVKFVHVDGHAGIEFNERADRLARKGSLCDKESVIYLNGSPVVPSL